MHWCAETIGARYSVSIACLRILRNETLWECEEECNEQFMTIAPVDAKWIDTNMTIFSK